MKEHFGCVGNTIRLRSGKYLDLANPKPDQFTFYDIAGALSKICRFGGQIERFYSVAEHSAHCAWVAQADGLSLKTRAALLLHDAAEAYIGDCVKPLKLMLPDYQRIEQRIENVIAEKFGVDFEREKGAVRKIDQEMLIHERRLLFSRDSIEWFCENEVRPLNVRLACWEPAQAESQFVIAAREIGIEVRERIS